MSRFTLRDLLWLTLVVGMALAWWLDRSEISRLRADLDASDWVFGELTKDMDAIQPGWRGLKWQETDFPPREWNRSRRK